MTKLQVTTINDEPAIVLPPSVVERLGIKEGDEIHLEDGPNGLRLVHPNPVVEAQVRTMNEVMDRRRDVLKRLAE
ncbi:MAG: AbrB/MazE/SpoVT family DNA-binding domain-containing protein [Planctomycetota bacterium]